MDSSRRCTRNSCERPAAATLTYSYKDSTVVVGPLSVYAEPHTYDLCDRHAASVTPPRGWEVLRLNLPGAPKQVDDLLALADAVRESPEARAAARARSQEQSSGQHHDAADPRPAEPELPARSNRERMAPPARTGGPGISRGHLRLLDD
ncbi:DUF3499 domain-containing protein [Nesterenkonia halotolerans]|uniref:DUF3499 domain-containing protein n=1 Tax=Nesterenkonia halotolerans TaxID=225325 RepID=UPI003EE7A38D